MGQTDNAAESARDGAFDEHLTTRRPQRGTLKAAPGDNGADAPGLTLVEDSTSAAPIQKLADDTWPPPEYSTEVCLGPPAPLRPAMQVPVRSLRDDQPAPPHLTAVPLALLPGDVGAVIDDGDSGTSSAGSEHRSSRLTGPIKRLSVRLVWRGRWVRARVLVVLVTMVILSAWLWLQGPQPSGVRSGSVQGKSPSTATGDNPTASGSPASQLVRTSSAPHPPQRVIARVVSPHGGDIVASCALFTGRAVNLPRQHTLVLATANPVRPGVLDLQPVENWERPLSLREWTAVYVFDGRALGQRIEVSLLDIPLKTARKALAGNGSAVRWTAAQPSDAIARDQVSVIVRGGVHNCTR
jgi:hypothetical protein